MIRITCPQTGFYARRKELDRAYTYYNYVFTGNAALTRFVALSYAEPQDGLWPCYPDLLCTGCDLRASVLSARSQCFQSGCSAGAIGGSLVGYNANGAGCSDPGC